MIPAFTLRLLTGLAFFWSLLPTPLITSGFYRIQNLLVLGLSVLVTVTASQLVGLPTGWLPPAFIPWIAGGIALSAYMGSMLWLLERRRGGERMNRLILVLGLVLLLGLVTLAPQADSLGMIRVMLEPLTAAALLGAFTGAMLLGHWYLTATGMSLAPLERAVTICLLAVLVRGLVAGWTLAQPVAEAPLPAGVLLGLRWAAGIVGPLILSLLTHSILRYRNTQSATGVLFAAVILVFIGEAVALMTV